MGDWRRRGFEFGPVVDRLGERPLVRPRSWLLRKLWLRLLLRLERWKLGIVWRMQRRLAPPRFVRLLRIRCLFLLLLRRFVGMLRFERRQLGFLWLQWRLLRVQRRLLWRHDY
jgi:hypothetical protein